MNVDGVWSLNLGRWGRLRIRLHVLFLVFVLGTIYLAWLGEHTSKGLIPIAWASLAILFVSSLLHGIGHYFAVPRDDELVDLVVGPLGELSPLPLPYEARAELAVHLAGPLVNLAIGLFATFGLVMTREKELLGLLHPFAPLGIVMGSWWVVMLKLTLWINALLLMANLFIPAYPFDGGRILRAAIWGAWPDFGRRWAGLVVYWFAQVVVLVLLACAWVLRNQQYHGVLPMWLALTLLALVVYFSARQERCREANLLFTEVPPLTGRADPEEDDETRPEPTWQFIRRWWGRRQSARVRQQEFQEAQEEQRVDAILERVHAHGLDQLSQEERQILMRVSHRIRDRRPAP